MGGSGPAVLLLHGIGDSSEGWVPLMPALARRFTVIAPDLLGHGQSAKPRADYSVAAYANGMRDLLEVLGVDRVTVVGHSLGGGVAAQLAYQYPERVERLVLVSSGGVAREVSPVLRAAAAPFAELTLPLLQTPPSKFMIRRLVQLLSVAGHDLGRDADEVMRIIEGMPDGPARSAFSHTLRSVVDWRGQLVTMLDRIYLAGSMPSLLVWGAHDGIIPVAHAQLAHRAMPGSRLEIYPEAGHFPHHADPIRFVTQLEDFIDSTEPFLYDAAKVRAKLRAGAPGRVASGVTEPVYEVEA
jgi:pimeloyl-ACP methyl ester carboxylesterase